MHILRINTATEFVAIVEQFIQENEDGRCPFEASLEIIQEMCRQTDASILLESLTLLKEKLDAVSSESSRNNQVSLINMDLFDKEA